MYRDHEFDPVTPEEQARREQEENRVSYDIDSFERSGAFDSFTS